MKKTLPKIISLFLVAILMFSCTNQPENPATESSTTSTTATTETSAETTTSETTTEPKYLVSPEDEISVTEIFTAKSVDGIEIEVTVHGYRSSLGYFYLKSNTPALFEIKITNNSDMIFFQGHPTDSEFPFVYWYIQNNNGAKLVLEKPYGFQEANTLEKIYPGETRVLHQYFIVDGSEDMLVGESHPMTTFGGHQILSYGLFDREITFRDFSMEEINERYLVWSLGFRVALMTSD